MRVMNQTSPLELVKLLVTVKLVVLVFTLGAFVTIVYS